MSYNNIVGSGYGRRKPLQSANFPTSPQPKSVLRPKQWDDKVEEGIKLYLFPPGKVFSFSSIQIFQNFIDYKHWFS